MLNSTKVFFLSRSKNFSETEYLSAFLSVCYSIKTLMLLVMTKSSKVILHKIYNPYAGYDSGGIS